MERRFLRNSQVYLEDKNEIINVITKMIQCIFFNTCSLFLPDIDEHVTAVPFFQTSKCPCGPGYIILSKFRSIKRCLRRLPHYRVFTECLWDYTPCTDDGLSPASMIPIVTVCDRPASTFRFVASGMRGNESKTIKITFHGKRVSELDLRQHKLLDRNVSTLLFGL